MIGVLYNFAKSLFCTHDMVHTRNLHGDEINGWDGNRSLWTCSKCGSLEARPELFTRVMPVSDTVPGCPAWIDDPHDIEGGQIINPEWAKHNAAKADYLRGDYSKVLVVDGRTHPNPHAALIAAGVIWESWEPPVRGHNTIFYGCLSIPSTLPPGIRVP